MEKLTANTAKTRFGELLLKAQKSPVQIDKNGRPVAVVMSIEDYQITEQIKQELLQKRLKAAHREVKAGLYEPADDVFESLSVNEPNP
ncbi:type II toxin-antitoxin system Phd/YefM family antitoxin [Marinicella gelatinilytica]|uniref:type II toxin-antitoxin system Phd/YefM family antitoxin n=1 Tax=Marinicella gelatinilytica TaxID=2996017 RepID=UPI002260C0AD|nr:type II toxin-antitoxin system prevent-host-death family antitoxin [Marinicella gelatinilytica]MCX7545632.1 type II toxin-antitoxin system prevent-host-death family antitoxin [Marinicella gelatinilytica]